MSESPAKRPEERLDADFEGAVQERRVKTTEKDFPGDLVSYCSALWGMEMPWTVICSVDQGRTLLFDQHSEKLDKVLSENVRGSSDHDI
jgi:hypothetical protein